MLKLLPFCALALAVAAPAAAENYSFNFSGPTLFGTPAVFTGTGVFTTSGAAMTVNGRTAYAITGISGTFDGSTITGLQAGFLGSNNLYFTSGPSFVDGSGVGFVTAAGTSASLYFQGTGQYRVSTTNPFATGFVTASSMLVPTASPAPEPTTWAMMIVGFGVAGASLRRRKAVASLRFA